MLFLLWRGFKSLGMVVHETKRLVIETKGWTKFIYRCTVVFVSKAVFRSILQSMEKKNNDQNIELENRMRAKYEKYDKDSQVVLKLGHEKKKDSDE